MTTIESSMFYTMWLVLTAVVAISVWLCFRRTGARSFLFLGAVLIIWPFFDGFTEALRKHFVEQAVAGQQPWLFPFSMMVTGSARGCEMSPGEFLTKFNATKELLLFALLAISFVLLARTLKQNKPSISVREDEK